MSYTLNDLIKLQPEELRVFFNTLLKEFKVESYRALQELEDKAFVMEFLTNSGFGAEDKNLQGATLLHFAASAGLVSAVDALLSLGYSNETTNSGASIGHYAAQAGQTEAIKAFVARGLIRLDVKDRHGAGLVMTAARGGRVETLSELVALGLKKNEKNNDSSGVLHYAVLGAPISAINALINDLHYDPSSKNRFGDTVLHYAARFGKTKLIPLFIEHYGLNPEIKNSQHKTLFDLAMESGSQETVDLCFNIKKLKELYQNYLMNEESAAEVEYHSPVMGM